MGRQLELRSLESKIEDLNFDASCALKKHCLLGTAQIQLWPMHTPQMIKVGHRISLVLSRKQTQGRAGRVTLNSESYPRKNSFLDDWWKSNFAVHWRSTTNNAGAFRPACSFAQPPVLTINIKNNLEKTNFSPEMMTNMDQLRFWQTITKWNGRLTEGYTLLFEKSVRKNDASLPAKVPWQTHFTLIHRLFGWSHKSQACWCLAMNIKSFASRVDTDYVIGRKRATKSCLYR